MSELSPSATTRIARAKYNKADRLLKLAGAIFIIFLTGVFIFISVQLYQVQNTIALNQTLNAKASADRFTKYTEDNAIQHKKTQQYVRCIAQVLLQPIDRRTNVLFDQCSSDVTIKR